MFLKLCPLALARDIVRLNSSCARSRAQFLTTNILIKKNAAETPKEISATKVMESIGIERAILQASDKCYDSKPHFPINHPME